MSRGYIGSARFRSSVCEVEGDFVVDGIVRVLCTKADGILSMGLAVCS